MNSQNDSQDVAIQEHMKKIDQMQDHKVRMQTLYNNYELQLINWYFLLNSGGLIGTLTLLSAKNGKYQFFCIMLALCFSAGLLFIIIASKLTCKRILPEFDRRVKREQISDTSRIDIFEYLSIISFAVGLLIGIIALIHS